MWMLPASQYVRAIQSRYTATVSCKRQIFLSSPHATSSYSWTLHMYLMWRWSKYARADMSVAVHANDSGTEWQDNYAILSSFVSLYGIWIGVGGCFITRPTVNGVSLGARTHLESGISENAYNVPWDPAKAGFASDGRFGLGWVHRADTEKLLSIVTRQYGGIS